MVRFFRAVTVMAVFILYPAQANANAVLPWFDTSEIASSFGKETKNAAKKEKNSPKKRMLAMSIGGTGKTSALKKGVSQSSSCPLAVFVSLIGLVGIGTLTRKDPLAEGEKVL
tara:strand:- start:435 stop:773 length:339 start_codon:yes stop_codon:yes gene_type:complete